MSGTIHKEVRPWVDRALRAGWKSKKIKGGIMLLPPDKDAKPVVIHGSISPRDTPRNIRQGLRRAGLDV